MISPSNKESREPITLGGGGDARLVIQSMTTAIDNAITNGDATDVAHGIAALHARMTAGIAADAAQPTRREERANEGA
jgi:hypothetical protein